MNSKYPIPAADWRVEEKIKGSLFIASGGHAGSSDGAKLFIDKIRKKFCDANHNCFAYVAGPPGSQLENGMSDDGEPRGTAGKPMLTTLVHSPVGEVVVVVTRYFGGTKLGTGGLVRAYSGLVKLLLESPPLKEKFNGRVFRLAAGYEYIGSLKQLIIKAEAETLDERYTDTVQMDVMLMDSMVEMFKSSAVHLTNGTVVIEEL